MSKEVLNMSSDLRYLICEKLGVKRLPVKEGRELSLFLHTLLYCFLTFGSFIYFDDHVNKFFNWGPFSISGGAILLLMWMIVGSISFPLHMKRINKTRRILIRVRRIREQLDFGNENEYLSKEILSLKLRNLAMEQICAEKIYTSARPNMQISRDKFREIDDRRVEISFKFDRVERVCSDLGIIINRREVFKKAEKAYDELTHTLNPKSPV